MSGYSELKSSINRVIKTNDNREITGQILQNTLNSMVNSLGANYHFSGFASPITNPGMPDQNIFYITTEEGIYVNFDRIELGPGLSFLLWRDNQWSHETLSTGDATKKWVQENYVSIDFFRSLFRAYDENGNEILPNNNPEGAMPSVVDNIKAMVGFWTEQYISALGQQTGGGGGGGATSLDELSDVFLTNPSLGQALVFTITPDHPEGIWVNQTIQAGTDMATVWAALAGNTTQQINISHLTDALADYATKTYVEQNFITVAYFDKLFRAYNGSTLVSHNDVTSTIDNIKAMFGFWTEQYLSALGNNSGGGGQLLALSNMADVTLTAPIADKQVLTFDAVTQKWVNGNGGASSIATLTDVTLTSLQTNQILIYDATTQKWVNSSIKTINGYSIFGTGDIPASGGGGGNYLPLSGGTLTGWLTVQGTITSTKDSAYSGSSEGGEIILKNNYNSTYDIHVDCYQTAFRIWGNGKENFVVDLQKEENYIVGMTDFVMRSNYWIQGPRIRLGRDHEEILNDRAVIGVSNGNLHIDAYNGYAIYLNFFQNDSSNSAYKKVYFCNNVYYIDGNGYFSGTANNANNLAGKDQYLVSQGLSSNRWSYRMIVGDNTYGHVAFLGTYSNDTFVAGLYGHNAALTAWDSVGIGGTSIRFYLGGNASGNTNGTWNTTGLGVGTDSPSYKLHVAGTIYATGAITALSDARKKDITGETELNVEQIAHAPAVQFLWKDEERRKDGQQVGTLAQYWKTVLPEVVSDKGSELSIQYGVAALVSAIITARKVVDHERRIIELEKENERLRKEIEQLRLN